MTTNLYTEICQWKTICGIKSGRYNRAFLWTSFKIYYCSIIQPRHLDMQILTQYLLKRSAKEMGR